MAEDNPTYSPPVNPPPGHPGPQYGPQPPVATPPQPAPPPPEPVEPAPPEHTEVYLYSHSPLVYWWPVWVVGYVMYGLTWWYGEPLTVGGEAVKFHPGSSLGVLFFLTLFLVIVISNVSVRGYASGMVVMGIITVAVVLAYFGFWGPILGWFGDLNVYLNQGAYFWFSTLMLLVWALSVFVLDRFTYWKVTAGQLTRVTFLGAGARSYDTQGMMFEKRRDDLFKHWVLGLGSGDLRIQTFGGRAEEIIIPNVMFVGSRVHAIQHLIAMEPNASGHTTVG